MKEGDDADKAVQDASKRTMSREDLKARHEHMAEISPEVGELDEQAFDDLMGDDPDAAMALLADLTGATDRRLAELARRLAGRVVVDVARRGPTRRTGIGSLRLQPFDTGSGDLDVDASLDPLVLARGANTAPALDELRARAWSKPSTALCLVVDRSGSMGGDRLATAAVAASSVAWRAPEDFSVLAFAADVIVVKAQGSPLGAETIVNRLLTLRGFGTTDLALALRTAGEQLARTRATRRITVLLSDCRSTVPGDAEAVARGLEELVVVAPADDSFDAEAFARATGARWAPLSGPSAVPEVLATLLS